MVIIIFRYVLLFYFSYKDIEKLKAPTGRSAKSVAKLHDGDPIIWQCIFCTGIGKAKNRAVSFESLRKIF